MIMKKLPRAYVFAYTHSSLVGSPGSDSDNSRKIKEATHTGVHFVFSSLKYLCSNYSFS